MVGDFNSHSRIWGYNHIEDWQDENNLTLINRPNDFYSRVWNTTRTPDITLYPEDLHRIIERERWEINLEEVTIELYT